MNFFYHRIPLINCQIVRRAALVISTYHMERRGMQLHDAFGINCKKGATTENRGSASQVSSRPIWAKGCRPISMTVCVLADLT